MKPYRLSLLIAFLFFVPAALFAQDAKQLHETGRTFMMQKDYANAVLVLNRALRMAPNDLEIAKDLGLNYSFEKEYNKALDIYKPLLERADADDQVFQVAGDIYLALEQPGEAEKIYKKGIKKFPDSGPLYNELGETLWAEKDYDAIKEWEKGIAADPGYSRNYYNACKYYYFSTDKVWSLLYGEIFLNIEPAGSESPEIKNILLEGYKKLFADADIEKANKDKNSFLLAFLEIMARQGNLVTNGITTESLIMVRTRFVLDWFASTYAKKFPFRLFELQRQLLQEGMFDAYNQWLFGAAENLAAYQNWSNTHPAEYEALNHFQKGRIFRIPTGQYYH